MEQAKESARTSRHQVTVQPRPLNSRKLSPTIYEYYLLQENSHTNPQIVPVASQTSDVLPENWTAKNVPSVVVIFGSSHGPLHAMTRFVRGYLAMFQGARIFAVTSTSKALYFQSDETAAEAMRPLLNELSEIFPGVMRPAGDTRDQNGILPVVLHALSNGGLISLRSLCLAWQNTFSTAFPSSLVVLDSCPGSGNFNAEAFRWAESAVAPFVAGNPTFKEVFGAKLLLTAVALGWIALAVGLPELLTGRQNLVAAGRSSVQNPQLLDPRGGIVYIYSVSDMAVRWSDVEANIKDIRDAYRDRSISVLKLEESDHLTHVKVYASAYWSEVRRAWDRSDVRPLLHVKSRL